MKFTIVLPLSAMVVVFSMSVAAQESTLEGAVTSITADGIYIDLGREVGVQAGDAVDVLRDGQLITTGEVVHISSASSLVRVDIDTLEIQSGDLVRVSVSSPEPDEPPEEDPEIPEGFTPLLTPPQRKSAARSKSANVFHGHVRLHDFMQLDGKTNLDANTTRLSTAGSLLRAGGSPWTLRWSASASQRSDDAFADVGGNLDSRLDVYRLSAARPFANGDSLVVGRFLPSVLPSAGYFDGVRYEHGVSEQLRVGGMLGVKPERDSLSPSIKEPVAVPYISYTGTTPGGIEHRTSAGILASLYEGDMDRLAVLVDQRVSLNGVIVDNSAVIDFDVGSSEEHSGTRLTDFNLNATWSPTPWLRLLGGISHHEQLDTAAEREGLANPAAGVIDHGYWRTRVGASETFRNWEFRQDVSVIRGEGSDSDPHIRLAINHRGLPTLPTARVGVSVFNLSGAGSTGYGSRLLTSVPLPEARVTLHGSAGYRFLESDSTGDEATVFDVSVNADWRLSNSWTTSMGISHSNGDGIEATTLSISFIYRW